jgi:hypothetical protein
MVEYLNGFAVVTRICADTDRTLCGIIPITPGNRRSAARFRLCLFGRRFGFGA